MRVVIIDYGSGNLRSVTKAFERAKQDGNLNHEIILTNQAEDVRKADYIVLPGVGAFADCRKGLDACNGMTEALIETAVKAGRPFMGICVGMQLLATKGLEKQISNGLNFIEGEVGLITPEDKNLKIPHMGWNTINLKQPHILFKDIETGENGLHAYFVHSYQFRCKNAENILATTEYSSKITAAIIKDNLFGTQFHPEKSQILGRKLIHNFLEWKP